jgi:hypothetical protein
MSLLSLRIPVAVIMVASPAMACGESEDLPTTPAPAVWFLTLVGGNNQEAVPGTELGSPFVVKVTNPTGSAAGVRVTWRVESGSGEFRHSAITATDAAGESWMHFTPATHRVTVSASVEGVAGGAVLFRTVPRPSGVYARISPSTFCLAGESCESYILYPDNTFTLRYSRAAYSGTFSPQDSVILLSFREDPGWNAAGTLRGDSLVVVYNSRMMFSDFEDGVYLRSIK